MRKTLTAALGTVLGIGLLVVAALWVTHRPAPHTLEISYPTASGLVPGSDVYEAGAKVGSVSDIKPGEGKGALVVVQVDNEHWPLHEGLTADIRPKSLLGEKYVDLHDGNKSGSVPEAAKVTAAADSTPVELDQFINSLDANTRDAAKLLINDLGAGLAGRGADLNVAIDTARQNLDHLKVTGTTLNQRDPDLDTILVGLDGVLGKLTTDDQLNQLSQLITNGQTTLNAVEAEKATFSRSFVDAQTALTELNQAIGPAVLSLRDTINTAPGFLTVLHNEADVLAREGASVTGGLGQPSLLEVINQGLIGGPTVLGGAVESGVPGKGLVPITRVCVKDPDTSGPSTSCTGNGFHPPSTTTPAVAGPGDGANGGGGAELVSLVGFIEA